MAEVESGILNEVFGRLAEEEKVDAAAKAVAAKLANKEE